MQEKCVDLSSGLNKEALASAPKGVSFFLITSEEETMRSASALGFLPVTTRTHPEILKWASEVGVVCRLPDSIHPIAPGTWGAPKGGEQWLFVR